MPLGRLWMFVLLAGLTAFPVLGGKYTIDTAPVKGGRIFINGNFAGVAPVTVKQKLKKNEVAVVTAEKAGAVSLWPASLEKNQKGVLLVRLEQDQAFNATVESDVANKWITITPRFTKNDEGAIDEDRVWQKVVSLVTDNFSDLEQLDRDSYYLRSTWRVRVYPFSVLRHRLVVKRGFAQEVSLKVQLESQLAAKPPNRAVTDTDYRETTRVFPQDKETLDFMRDQL